MKKYVLMVIGFILLIIDIRIGVIDFPAFEKFRTEATVTVDMVINHVVGDKMVVDIFSDALGFLLLFAGCLMFIKDEKYDDNSKAARHFGKLLPLCFVGIALYLVEKLMPFWLNGNLRFRSEYALFFLYLAAKATAMGRAMFGVAETMESTESHIRNNLSIILIMLSLGTFVVSKIAFFYDVWGWLVWVYTIISVLFAVLAGFRVYSDSKKFRK